MYNFLALFTPLLSCFFLIRALKLKGVAEKALFFFCFFTAHIVTFGYMLSLIDQFKDIRLWSMSGLASAVISFIIFILNRDPQPSARSPKCSFSSLMDIRGAIKDWYRNKLSFYEKITLIPMISTVFLTGICNLTVVVFTAPHHWDGMTYHLARVAYYLQHNNLDYFDANYWAQVVHQKNSTILILYTYLVSCRQENLTQLVQYISYWIAICSIYAISLKIGCNKIQSLFAALISALLTETLMQATTTQNDMIITAYIGTAVYALFAFRETRNWKYLGFTALAIGLSIGTKASALLPLLSVAAVALYVIFRSGTVLSEKFRSLSILVGCSLAAIIFFSLPAGFIDNYRIFGHPIGPDHVRKVHSFEGESFNYIVRNGTKNLLRYGLEFTSLDGLPPIDPVLKVQSLIKTAPDRLLRILGKNLETSVGTRAPFVLYKMPTAHEDGSYWGIFGFGFGWIIVFLSLTGFIKSKDFKVLSLAAVLFLIIQAYAGPYDPWRGRYFTACAVFALPMVGITLRATNRFIRSYVIVIVLVGCLSALSAVLLRSNCPLISIDFKGIHKKSVFQMNRMEQLTRNRPTAYEALAAFDRSVANTAIVATCLAENFYEYPLFGKHLTRTIIPINSFHRGVQPIPREAEYLLYDGTYSCPSRDDRPIGSKLYLRHLTESNRKCP